MRNCAAAISVSLFLFFGIFCERARAVSVWITAEEATPDFMEMFSPGSTWQDAIPGLTTIKLYQAFVADAPSSDLEAVISWAQENNIAIAVEGGVLPVASPSNCGWGVEGYNDAFVSQMQRFASLGGVVADVSMDEPLYFGSISTEANTCQQNISTTAQLVASTYKKLLNIFPNLQLTDIEPVPLVSSVEYSQWLADLNADLPEKLSSFQADLLLGEPFESDLVSIDQDLVSDGVSPGVIVDAAASADSNAAWVQSAVNTAALVEDSSMTCVGTLDVQTWESYPTEVLGPDTPGSLSNAAYQVGQLYEGNPCASGGAPEAIGPFAVTEPLDSVTVPEPPSGAIELLPLAVLVALVVLRRRRGGLRGCLGLWHHLSDARVFYFVARIWR